MTLLTHTERVNDFLLNFVLSVYHRNATVIIHDSTLKKHCILIEKKTKDSCSRVINRKNKK